MSIELLGSDQIQQRIDQLKAGAGPVQPAQPTNRPAPAAYRYIRPLDAAANSLIEALQVRDGIGLGLAEIDILTRGFRGTDLVIITGFAHSGKTQLVNTAIVNNPGKRILFFSLDDPAEMILAKLVAMTTGIPAVTIEQEIRDGSIDMQQAVHQAATERFSNLLVVDDVIGIAAMQEAVREAEELWGAAPDAVIIDYIEMLPGSISDDQSSSVKEKANDLKRWAKASPFPIIALHQGSRSNARPGDPITLLSMGFSGEQQATIVIGCRRKRDRSDLDPWERQAHEQTITLHVVKNKRPGGRLTNYDGIDLGMDEDTGLIRPLSGRERARTVDPDSAAARAERAVQSALDVRGHGRHVL